MMSENAFATTAAPGTLGISVSSPKTSSVAFALPLVPPPQLLFAAYCRMMAASSAAAAGLARQPPLHHRAPLHSPTAFSPPPAFLPPPPPSPPAPVSCAAGGGETKKRATTTNQNPFIAIAAAAHKRQLHEPQPLRKASSTVTAALPRKGRITVAELMGQRPPPPRGATGATSTAPRGATGATGFGASPQQTATKDDDSAAGNKKDGKRQRSWSNSAALNTAPQPRRQVFTRPPGAADPGAPSRAAGGGGAGAAAPPGGAGGTRPPGGGGRNVHNRPPQQQHAAFLPYFSHEAISDGLKRGQLIQGALRVNQKNYEEAFVDNPNEDDQDILIYGHRDRNRVLHGDIVVCRLKPRHKWIGALRVNQKNYEEAFVDNPNEDDQDILIYGHRDRNRVLHGDIVVCRLKPRHKWIVQENLYQAYKAGNKAVVAPQPIQVHVQALATTKHAGSDQKTSATSSNASASGHAVRSELESPPGGLQTTGAVAERQQAGTVRVVVDLQEGVTFGLDPREGEEKCKQERAGTKKQEGDAGESVYARSKMVRIWQKVDHLFGHQHYAHDSLSCASAAAEQQKKQHPQGTELAVEEGGEVDPETLRRIAAMGITRRPAADANERQRRRSRGDSEHAVWDRTIVGHPVNAQTTKAGGVPARPQQQQHGMRKRFKTADDYPGETVPDECLQKTAEVVGIIEKKHNRAAVGCLKPFGDNSSRRFALFSPTDSRMPRMLIPAPEVPEGFFNRPGDFVKFIYIARMVDWQATENFALGRLHRHLGLAGELEPETEGLLVQYDVDTREFSNSCLASLKAFGIEDTDSGTWKIPELEYKYRRDFRDEVVFTIDPATARDLDDALHVKPMDGGDYELGVHIADVSYFVKHETELDQWAARRATSTYLVHKVIPMLPRVLCEELCSLNPGVDRLSFSVVWRLNAEGKVKDEWFGRSVIRSRCKLAYDHAQGFIDEPERDWATDELPALHGADTTARRLSDDVNVLHALAAQIRARRFDGGALRIDLPKLSFTLDKETQLPVGCSVYKQRDSNRLIEEFMLMANMAVAKRIYDHYPKAALLRRHPPPNPKLMKETMQLCEKLGYPLEGMSSGQMQFSLAKYCGSDEKALAVISILNQLCMKPMRLAQYFCTGSYEDESAYRHYALSVPFYTHFTSPIRRYPDVMVHRLLAASLSYAPAPSQCLEEIEALATHSNERKTAAKTVSELSAEMCFAVFVKDCGPITERAVVMNVLDHSFDVLLIRYGLVKRVYTNKLALSPSRGPLYEEGPPPTLTLFWPASKTATGGGATRQQHIGITTIVDCVLSGLPEPLKFMATIEPPQDDK